MHEVFEFNYGFCSLCYSELTIVMIVSDLTMQNVGVGPALWMAMVNMDNFIFNLEDFYET